MGSFRNARPLPLDETSFYDAVLGAVDGSDLITDPSFGGESDAGGVIALLFGPSAPAHLVAEARYDEGIEEQWIGSAEVELKVLSTPARLIPPTGYSLVQSVLGEDITESGGRITKPIGSSSSVTGWPVVIGGFPAGLLDAETEGVSVSPEFVRVMWQSGAHRSRELPGLPQLLVNLAAVTPTVASTRRITVGATTYEVVGVFGVVLN